MRKAVRKSAGREFHVALDRNRRKQPHRIGISAKVELGAGCIICRLQSTTRD